MALQLPSTVACAMLARDAHRAPGRMSRALTVCLEAEAPEDAAPAPRRTPRHGSAAAAAEIRAPEPA
jgi:hypothetical protein